MLRGRCWWLMGGLCFHERPFVRNIKGVTISALNMHEVSNKGHDPPTPVISGSSGGTDRVFTRKQNEYVWNELCCIARSK